MVDPVTAITAATSAFTLIKKGFAAGRDIESMYSDIGRWMGAMSDVNQAEKLSKNPPIFKKLFNGSSVEQEAMDAFAAKKKAEAMEDELRTWINLVHGPQAWSELLKMQSKIIGSLISKQNKSNCTKSRYKNIFSFFASLTPKLCEIFT